MNFFVGNIEECLPESWKVSDFFMYWFLFGDSCHLIQCLRIEHQGSTTKIVILCRLLHVLLLYNLAILKPILHKYAGNISND